MNQIGLGTLTLYRNESFNFGLRKMKDWLSTEMITHTQTTWDHGIQLVMVGSKMNIGTGNCNMRSGAVMIKIREDLMQRMTAYNESQTKLMIIFKES